MASISPVALALTGATALCNLVARTRRSAPPQGKSPVALALTGATALYDLVARIRRNAPPPGKSLRHQAFKYLTVWQTPDGRRRWCC
ncbi:hypothetical protein FMJ64_03375 [Klebsiella variicola]|nr:hypothetical protein [Klebsiella variicola]